MKTNLLFPHRYRLIGWILFVPSLVLGLFYLYADLRLSFLTFGKPDPNSALFDSWPINLTDEVAALGLIIGLLFIAFAREKHEDEMIQQLRLESLQWSVYANYIILSLAIILIHGSPFFVCDDLQHVHHSAGVCDPVQDFII